MDKKGFTFIELLIVMSLVTVISGVLYGTLYLFANKWEQYSHDVVLERDLIYYTYQISSDFCHALKINKINKNFSIFMEVNTDKGLISKGYFIDKGALVKSVNGVERVLVRSGLDRTNSHIELRDSKLTFEMVSSGLNPIKVGTTVAMRSPNGS